MLQRAIDARGSNHLRDALRQELSLAELQLDNARIDIRAGRSTPHRKNQGLLGAVVRKLNGSR